MAIPSGGGSEVLKTYVEKNISTSWHNLINGADNHIYTMLHFSICDAGGTGLTFKARILTVSGADIYMYQDIPIGVKETFMHNDKFAVEGNRDFQVQCSADAHVLATFIDQDWT